MNVDIYLCKKHNIDIIISKLKTKNILVIHINLLHLSNRYLRILCKSEFA